MSDYDSNENKSVNSELDSFDIIANTKQKKTKWKALINVSIFFLIAIGLCIFGMIILSSISINSLQNIQNSINKFDSWFMFIRFSIIITIIAYWGVINTWLATRNDWNDAHLQRILKGRWTALTVLLFIELILVQKIHQIILN